MPPGTDAGADESPSWISTKFLTEVLRQEKDVSREVKVLGADIKPAVDKGDNFLSTLHRVRVRYQRTLLEVSVHNLDIIVKEYPPGDALRKFISEAGFFAREINTYRIAFPLLYQFASKCLPRGHVTRFSPKCYLTDYSDKLVLEDLATQGFEMADRRNMLDLVHCKLVLRRLSRLHAISYVYACKDPSILDTLKDDIYVEKNRKKMRQFLEPQMKCFVEIAEKWPTFETIVKKIRKMIPYAVDKLMSVCKPRGTGFQVLNHGDCWVNNILFKYSSNGELVDLRFVDYQMTRYASPALDLTYFMFTSLQTEVRAHYYDHLLVVYCDEFRRTATAMGYTGPLLALRDLQEEMRRVRFYGFTTAVGTLATALADPSEAMDLSMITDDFPGDTQDQFTKVHSSPRFKQVFQQLLPYFDKMDVFD